MPEPRLALVVAVADNGVIGREGRLPWRLPSDLKQFRRLTMGKPLIMGRKTFQSIGKPLDGRDNIVVTRDPAFAAEGVLVARSFEEAVALARTCAEARGADEIAVIGGAQIYAAALPAADRIYLTQVHGAFEGDTVFPALDRAAWQETARERHAAGPKDAADFSLVILDRIKG